MALQDRTGQKVPSVVFRTRVGDTGKMFLLMICSKAKK